MAKLIAISELQTSGIAIIYMDRILSGKIVKSFHGLVGISFKYLRKKEHQTLEFKPWLRVSHKL